MLVPYIFHGNRKQICHHQIRFRLKYIIGFDCAVCDKCGKKIRPSLKSTLVQCLIIFLIGLVLLVLCPQNIRNTYPFVAFVITGISYLASNIIAIFMFPFDYDIRL